MPRKEQNLQISKTKKPVDRMHQASGQPAFMYDDAAKAGSIIFFDEAASLP